MKQAIKCIIFDCDGVLVDSEPIGIQTLVDLANQLDIPIDYDFGVQQFQGNSMAEVLRIIQSQTTKPLPTNFEQTYRQESFKRFKSDLQPIPHIPEVLAQLSLPYCVASSGPVAKIRWNLEIIGVLQEFEGRIFSCYDLQKWKPDPAIYLHAAAAMGFPPSACLVIEDSLLGVQAGIASGCQVYAYATHAHNKEALEQAGATLFYDMKDLLTIS